MNRNIIVTRENHALLIQLLEARLKSGAHRDDEAFLRTLREMLAYANIVERIPTSQRVIAIGTTFKILNLFNMESFTYTLVLPDDADLDSGLLSIFDPLGATLIGYREGDIVEFDPPYGGLHVKVVNIIDNPAKVLTLSPNHTDLREGA